jgi:AraC-like DNA-binding protein
MSSTPIPDSAVVRSAISQFMARGGIRKVALAAGHLPPPQLAYLVNFPRLSVVLSGRERIEFDTAGELRGIVARRGDALFVPANGWNRPTPVGPATVLTVLFGKRQTGLSLVRTTPTQVTATKAGIHRPLHGPLPGILDALNHLAADDPGCPSARSLVDAALHACVSLLADSTPDPGRKAARTFHNICLYLQENFQFQLTRETVADHFDLSSNHVSRLFRREGLMNFNEYLTWVRIDRAKYLLRRHDVKLTEVSAACGFNDVGYFCRIFKRRTKRTPSEYRQTHPLF